MTMFNHSTLCNTEFHTFCVRPKLNFANVHACDPKIIQVLQRFLIPQTRNWSGTWLKVISFDWACLFDTLVQFYLAKCLSFTSNNRVNINDQSSKNFVCTKMCKLIEDESIFIMNVWAFIWIIWPRWKVCSCNIL